MTSLTQELCALFGSPVAGNPTQFMIEKAFNHHGLDWRYLTILVSPEDLPDAIRGMRAFGFRGANVTAPHKVSVVAHLDRLTVAAQKIGAVNCIIREGNELVGENTDGKGFLESLKSVQDPTGLKVVMIGAGGAARAIAVELALAGVAEITVANRTASRGQELVAAIQAASNVAARYVPLEGALAVPEGVGIVVNATSIGMNDPDALVPIQFETIDPLAVVADVVAFPPDTRFLEKGAQRGCRTLDGLGMIVNQGAIAFKLWTGVDPDRSVMRDAVEEYLSV